MILLEYIKRCQDHVDERLKQILPTSRVNSRLNEAMFYAVFSGGKRVRPILTYAVCEVLGGDLAQADPAACAVELVHNYSLVHDDLPAMDDDNSRRGKPTCHIAFDEATAILVGDALQTLAFEVLINTDMLQYAHLTNSCRLKLALELAIASGHAGMCRGQFMDLNSVGSTIDQKQLQLIYSHKTGDLIKASVIMGALSSGNATIEQLTDLSLYAETIGLAFQIQDDILDVTTDTENLRKNQKAHGTVGKTTYVSLIGLDNAKKITTSLCQMSIAALDNFGNKATILKRIAEYMIHRLY